MANPNRTPNVTIVVGDGHRVVCDGDPPPPQHRPRGLLGVLARLLGGTVAIARGSGNVVSIGNTGQVTLDDGAPVVADKR